MAARKKASSARRPKLAKPRLAKSKGPNPYEPALARLWAPWRLEYIRNIKTSEACPFCEAPRSEPSDENLVLFRNEDLFVVLNKFPYNPGHLLVLPRKHLARPEDFEPGLWMKLAVALRATVELLGQVIGSPGFNVGLNLGSAAGGGIPGHLHWHIVPRWPSDSNFLPVVAETKALPSHNRTVWNELRPRFLDFERKLTET